MDATKQLENICADYANKLSDVLDSSDWSSVAQLGLDMQKCWVAAAGKVAIPAEQMAAAAASFLKMHPEAVDVKGQIL